jgi:hypothetical protein
MSNLARKLVRQREIVQKAGTVVALSEGRLTVATEDGELEAKRAASCLAAPAVGDTVLVALTEGATYVLAILERCDEAGTCVSVEGDLTIRLPTGRLRVAAQEGIDLAAGKRMSLLAGELDVRAGTGTVVLQQLSFLGRSVLAEVERLKHMGGTFDSVVERVTQKVKRSYRRVEEIEQVRAERIDYAAERNMSLRGANTLITAKELVKLDGEQIHLG